MQALRLQTRIKKDGEIFVKDLPYKKGEQVELILLVTPSKHTNGKKLTARRLGQSEMVGMWKDRKDIKNSSSYARKLRRKAQVRKIEQ